MGVWHVFYTAVGPEFESSITVHEGQYGKFFTLDEALTEPTFLKPHQEVLRALVHIVSASA